MSNAEAPAPAGSLAPDPKVTAATEIYTSWRNAKLNQIPTEMFNRLEAAAPDLIAKIAARL